MSAMSDAAAALYDRYGGRMYALALRITGSPDAATSVLEETFAALGADLHDAGEASLLRLTRDVAIAGYSQSPTPRVEGMTPTPRMLVEEAFYRGSGVAELSRRYGLPETDVRKMIADGVRELKR
jgi:DNA-directed RNA polymerase specialized sigma24 family protein